MSLSWPVIIVPFNIVAFMSIYSFSGNSSYEPIYNSRPLSSGVRSGLPGSAREESAKNPLSAALSSGSEII